MNRIGLLSIALFLGLGTACQRDDQAVHLKLDDISRRLNSIEGRLAANPQAAGAAGAAAAQQRPARAKPDPNAVYATPIDQSAYVGPKHAKVTLVEAFTFT